MKRSKRDTSCIGAVGIGTVLLVTAFVPKSPAQSVADGSTSTSVAVDASGHQTIGVAAPNASGLSLNAYSNFSVGAAGADLDNRTSMARAIVNEVTSTRVSELRGPIEVLGPRAHVMIVNPNGIVVDGGRFVNVGGVVLATGSTSLSSQVIAPGVTSENLVIETSQGKIDVTGAGLGGAMTSLQMMAGHIRIDGPVLNTSSNLRSDIRLTAGASRVEYDSSVLPNADLENWGTLTVPTNAANAPVAVEITERGSLTANTVRIETTADGAGVRHAGEVYASLGDFAINSTGKISVAGSISAFGHVSMRGSEIAVQSGIGRPQTKLEAINGALTILASAGDIVNTGSLLSGKQKDAQSAESKGGVTLKAAGSIRLMTERPDQLAIVFSSQGDLDVDAGSDIVNNTGRLLSNARTLLSAGANIENKVDIVAGQTPVSQLQFVETQGSRLWYTLWRKRKSTLERHMDFGSLRVDGQEAYIVGSSVELVAGGQFLNSGGTVNGNNGSVLVTARSIVVEGLVTGTLDYLRVCGFTCKATGTSTIGVVGGQVNASGNISLTASERIRNAGQLVAFGDITLAAPQIEIEGTRLASVYTRPGGLFNLWSGSYAWISEYDAGGILSAPYGSIQVDAFSPVKLTAASLSANEGIEIPNGAVVVSAPIKGAKLWHNPIGFFRGFVGGSGQ